jgi:hypothetical protein
LADKHRDLSVYDRLVVAEVVGGGFGLGHLLVPIVILLVLFGLVYVAGRVFGAGFRHEQQHRTSSCEERGRSLPKDGA